MTIRFFDDEVKNGLMMDEYWLSAEAF